MNNEKYIRRNTDARSFLQKNWGNIIFVIGLVFSCGVAYATIMKAEPRLSSLESKEKNMEIRLVKLETIIQENLPDIKEFMKEIRKEIRRRR